MYLRRNHNCERNARPKSRTLGLISGEEDGGPTRELSHQSDLEGQILQHPCKHCLSRLPQKQAWTMAMKPWFCWNMYVLSPNNLARHMIVPMQKPWSICLSILLLLSPTFSLCPLLHLYQKRRGRGGNAVAVPGLQLSLPNSFTSPAAPYETLHYLTKWIVVSKVCVVSLVQYLPNSLSIYVKVGFC